MNLWTDHLDGVVRGKLVALWRGTTTGQSATSAAEQRTLESISISTGILNPPRIEDALISGDDDLALSYVDAIQDSLEFFSKRIDHGGPHNFRPTLWASVVPMLLNSHRVAFKFVDGQIIPLASEELHSEVVERVVYLLHGRPDLDAAQSAYRKALKEISNNDAGDAITDAGTALQETLKALGCQGNALGPLISDARAKGLLASHDQNLAAGIEKFAQWVSADRSTMGDAHRATEAILDDAWLMVHIVGALIVRLAGQPRRRIEGVPDP